MVPYNKMKDKKSPISRYIIQLLESHFDGCFITADANNKLQQVLKIMIEQIVLKAIELKSARLTIRHIRYAIKLLFDDDLADNIIAEADFIIGHKQSKLQRQQLIFKGHYISNLLKRDFKLTPIEKYLDNYLISVMEYLCYNILSQAYIYLRARSKDRINALDIYNAWSRDPGLRSIRNNVCVVWNIECESWKNKSLVENVKCSKKVSKLLLNYISTVTTGGVIFSL
jgi:hypothetical protein